MTEQTSREREQAQATRAWFRSITSFQGWPVLRVWQGAVYVRIPAEIAQPINGGCQCAYCKAHPEQIPTWDTLGIPITETLSSRPRGMTWTVHAPEWKETDKP